MPRNKGAQEAEHANRPVENGVRLHGQLHRDLVPWIAAAVELSHVTVLAPSVVALESSMHGPCFDCHLSSYLSVRHLMAIA